MKIDLRVISIDKAPWWRACDAERPHIGGTGSCPAQAIGCMMMSHAPEIHGPLTFIWLSDMPKN